MSSTKVKVYKNPERNRPANLKPYVPQYQLMGVEPEEYHSPLAPGYASKFARPQPLPKDNPRAPKPAVRRQPYAKPTPSPIGRGRGLLPNVGNNVEQTWSGVDGEIIDDLTEPLDPNQEMVDNNDFMTDEALGLPPSDEPMLVEEETESPSYEVEIEEEESEEDEKKDPAEKNFLDGNELQNALKDEYLSAVVKNLEEDEYLLVVDGSAICSGPMEDIQEQARALVFGEHPLCGGNPMPIDDIIVLKRAKVKVGLFLE